MLVELGAASPGCPLAPASGTAEQTQACHRARTAVSLGLARAWQGGRAGLEGQLLGDWVTG